MNNRIAHHLVLIVGLCLLYATGCQSVNDLQPGISDNLPDSVLNVFQKAVPNAKDVVFKTVEQNWLYEVNYTLNGDRAFGLLDSKRWWGNYVWRGDVFPDSLKSQFDQLPAANGKTTGVWEPVFQEEGREIYYSNFDYEGRESVLIVRREPERHGGKKVLGVSFINSWRYAVTGITDETKFPAQVKAALSSRNLKFKMGTMVFKADGKRDYNVDGVDSASKIFSFSFNNELKMTSFYDGDPGQMFDVSKYPVAVQNFIKNSPYRDFEFARGKSFSDSDAPGFGVSLSTVKNAQSFSGTFDKEGNLMTWYYSGDTR